MVLIGLLLMRRKRQRVGLTHKVSDTNSSLDTPISFPTVDGEIDSAEFVICRDARGDEVCLGEGNFGKARTLLQHASRALQSLSQGLATRHSR